jgi:NTE family protein
MRPAIPAPAKRSAPGPWEISLTAGLVVAIASMDLTMVGTAIPILGVRAMNGELAQLIWTLVITTIPVALLIMPALARANRIGRKRVARAGMLMFTAGAIIAAIAPTLGILIAGRLLQSGIALGIAGTLAFCASGPNAGRMLTRWAAAGAIGIVTGPVVAGVLLQFGSWRLLFALEAVLGVVAYVLIRRFLVEGRSNVPPPRSDVTNGVLLGFGLLLLAWGSTPLTVLRYKDLASDPSDSAGTISAVLDNPILRGALFVAGALLIVFGFVRIWRARTSQRQRMLLPVGMLTPAAIGIALAASLLTNALYLAGTRQLDPWPTALGLLPLLASLALTAMIVRGVARPSSDRWLLIVGGLIWMASLVTLMLLVQSADDGWTMWILLLVAQGVGMGVIVGVTGDPSSLTGDADATDESVMVGIARVLAARQLGVAIGILVLSILFLGTELTNPANLDRGWLIGAVAGASITVLAVVVRRPRVSNTVPLNPSIDVEERQSRRGEVRRRPTAALLDFLRQRDLDPLATLPMFADLSQVQRDLLAQEGEDIHVPAGESIYSTGDHGDAVYIVRSGRVDLEVNGISVRRLGRGEVFGESEVLDGSPRTVSAVARRDCALMRLQRSSILNVDDASFFRAIAISLSERLAELTPRVAPIYLRSESGEAIISVIAADPAAPTDVIGRHLEDFLQPHRTVIAPGRVDRLGLERAESLGDIVLLIDDPTDQEWSLFCRRVADRMVVVTTDPAPTPGIAHGSHVVIVDAEPTTAQLTQWFTDVRPASRTLVRSNHLAGDLAPLGDRLLNRSLGVAMGGGGARGLAHIGVMDVLTDAGIRVDRISGTSMGAVIGAGFASGLDPDSVDALFYDLMVRGNPMSDYTLPRKSLIRGRRLDSAIHGTFGDARIEVLPMPFACVSVDLVTRQEVVHRAGPLADAVAASSRLPGILPPYRHSLGGVHVDGGLLNNLPVNTLDRSEGPVIAIQVGGQESLTEEMALEGLSLGDTIMRSLMMASDNANAEAIEQADLLIRPETSSAGLTEFHRLDAMREAGQRAALEALPEIRNLINRS